jgi:hypothetical protein
LYTCSTIDSVLIPLLLDPQATQKRLIITGHSLGGGLATLALAYLLSHPDLDFEKLPFKIQFVAIAPLRVGDDIFEKQLKEKVKTLRAKNKCSAIAVMHDLDPCPCLPPEWCGFKHATTTAMVTVKKVGDNLALVGGEMKIGAKVEDDGAKVNEGKGCCKPEGKCVVEKTKNISCHHNEAYTNILDSIVQKYS